MEVKSDISRLKLMGVEVNLHWSPGHSDIKGNETAEMLAKEEAQQAKDQDKVSSIMTLEDVKTAHNIMWNHKICGTTQKEVENCSSLDLKRDTN